MHQIQSDDTKPHPVLDHDALPPTLRHHSKQVQESYLWRRSLFPEKDTLQLLEETLQCWGDDRTVDGKKETVSNLHRSFHPNVPFEHCYIEPNLSRRLLNWLSIDKPFAPSWQSRFHASHRGLLLYGPSGCGKSHLVQTLLTPLVHERPLYTVVATELFGKYLGESEKRLRNVFSSLAKERDPILVIEGLDLLGRKRNQGNGDDEMESSVSRRLLTTLLTLLDGVDTVHSIKVIGMTRTPWLLDEALLRPGRFDTLIPILPPQTEQEVTGIVNAIMKRLGINVPFTELVDYLQRHVGHWRPSHVLQCVQQFMLQGNKSWEEIASTIIDTKSTALQQQIERLQSFSKI